MRIKEVLVAFFAGMLGAICIILFILGLGLNTEAIVFGANKYNFFFFEFAVLMTTCIIVEAVEGTGAREVAVDAILSAIIAYFVVKDDMPWLSIHNSISSAISMLKPAMLIGIISALFSTPVTKLVSSLLDKEIQKN